MGRTGAFLAVLTVLATVPLAAAGGPFGGLTQQSVDADVVVMTADVGADGDAQWTVAYRVRLDDDNDTRAFEDLQADIAANTSAYTDRFGDRMARTARTAENATGREMAIRNVTVETTQESFGQNYGVVTYRFQWANFAAVDGERLEIGDAVSGLFLDADTSLTIRWPAAYEVQSVSPDPDERTDRSATWRGQQSFGAEEPRVAVSTGAGGPSALLLGAGAVAVLAVALGVYAARRRGDETPGDGDEQSGQTAVGDGPETPPADLLSNEEQVLELLARHDGRIKQQRLASELDWTAAKTSQVISGLRDDGEIETFRIGRENVVTLPDTDLTGDEDDA